MSESMQTQEDVTIQELQVSQVKVVGADRLPNLGRRNWNKRRYFASIKIGRGEKKTKSLSSKSPVSSKPLSFINIKLNTDFEAVIYVRRLLHKDAEVGSISVSVKSILESRKPDGSCIVTSDITSCPGAQLEFIIKMTDSRSVTTEATNAVAAAREALEILSPPSAIQGAITVKDDGAEIVGEVETAEETLSPIVKTIDVGAFMEKVEMFFKIVDVISEVHPYAKMALSLVKGAYAIVQNQVQRDQKIQDLFAQMTSLYDIVDDLKRQLEDGGIKSSTELLARICKQTIDCCYFIRSYASPRFMQRMAKSTFSTTVDKRISEYGDAFKSLKDEFYGKLHIETRVIVSRVLSDVKRLETKSDLSDISYSRESSLGPSKGCLPGTREEPLERMTTWANSDSHDQPSILVLTGPAGTGKSALAHTMAHQFRELGRLGSSFGFVRTDPTLSNDSTRRIEFLFPTIALGLADFDENIRDALWAAVGKSKEKRTTQDLSLQFDNLIAKPLKSVVLSGPVLIVIDALDECGEAQTREQLLLILKMCAGDLPLNIRLLITSRPEDDILTHLQDSAHIRKWRMDEISSSDQTFQDISLYTRYRLISSRPSKLEGIDEECCRQLAIKSQGLFQWASVACSQITAPNRAGSSPRERYEMLVEGGSGPSVDQESILDALYRKILQQLFPKDSTTEVEMARFKSILAAVLASFEPLALESLNILRKASNDASAPYADAKIILQYLGSLLSGVTASDSHIPIRPLHTSFRDFLTNKQRGLDFFIDKIAVLQAHERLGLASLCVMNRELSFNICGLESSYVMNKYIPDLPKRIQNCIPERLSYSCRFFARHLDVALPNGLALEISRQIRGQLEPFVKEMILFWLEVLGLLDGIALAIPALAIVERALISEKPHTPNESLLGHIHDIKKFLAMFAYAISTSAPHVYISAVPFSPRGSWISKQYVPRLPRTPRVCTPPKDWPVVQGVTQHSDRIWDIAISTDGARIAGACHESGIFVWDTRTGLLDSVLLKCGGSARRVAFSPDGAQVGYALGNGTIGVWYIESGSTRTIAESIFGPTSDDDVCLTFSPDGRNLIVGSGGGTVRSWDMSTGDASGAILYQSIMKSRFESITFLADGTLVACGYNEQTIEICQWNAATLQLIGKPLRIEAGSRVYAVGMSSDGRYVAAALVPDIIHLWVLPEGTPVGVPVSVPWRPVWRITFPPDGSHFASAGWRGVDVMEITPTGPVLEVSLQGHTGLVRGLVYSPDGRHIFTCSVDCTIRKWDAHSTDKPDLIIHQYTSSIVGVHISHDGTIASVFEDGTVRLWDGITGRAIGTPFRLLTEDDSGSIHHSAMSQDGTRIVAFSIFEETVWLLDLRSCKWTSQRIDPGTDAYDTQPMFSLYPGSHGIFSPDGSRIYVTSRRRIHTIDVDTMDQTSESLTWKEFPVRWFYGPAVISPDGAQLAVLSRDVNSTTRLRILDSQTVEEVSPPIDLPFGGYCYRWCISPDFCYVAYKLEKKDSIKVICIEGGVVQRQISLVYLHHGISDTLVFLPYTTASEFRLVSAGDSGVAIWDLVSCTPILGPLRHYNTKYVSLMECSQDGNQLVVGYDDGAVLVWDISVSDDSHSDNSVTPIAFSPEAAYALPQLEDVHLHNVAELEAHSERGSLQTPIDAVKLTNDGWIVSSNSRLLFWVPPELRRQLWPAHRVKLALMDGPELIQLDLSQFVHGSRWSDCYSESSVHSDSALQEGHQSSTSK